MRFIDKYLGTLGCFLLTISNKASLIFNKNYRCNGDGKVDKILMIKFWGIGSIILATPAIRAVRERYPTAEIIFLTFLQNKEICESIGLIDEIITIESSSLSRFIYQTIKVLAYLRRLRLDLVVDLEFLARFSSIMTYLSSARKAAEFYSNILWRGDLSKIKVHYNCYFHVTENFLNLVRILGVKEKSQGLSRPLVDAEAKKKIGAIFKSHNITPNDILIMVNINSSDMARERRWPKEKFAVLINRLSKEYSLKIILIGGKEDKDYVDSFLDLLKLKNSVLNLAGKTNIKELIALLEQCSIFISNDSGPLHIAEALDIPTVSFFGPETPILYGPRGDKHLVYYNNLLCSPCMNIHNNKLVSCMMDNMCMKTIDADDVYDAIEKKYGYVLNNHKI